MFYVEHFIDFIPWPMFYVEHLIDFIPWPMFYVEHLIDFIPWPMFYVDNTTTRKRTDEVELIIAQCNYLYNAIINESRKII